MRTTTYALTFSLLALTSSITHIAIAAEQKAEQSANNDHFSEDDWSDDSWGDDSWGDDNREDNTESPWQVSGFAELGYGHFLQDNVVESPSSLSEARGRMDINYSHQAFEFNASGDLVYDDVLNDTFWQTRVLTLSTSFSMLDVKIGRQVLTWGTGDYVFLNDLFAKDWQSFFSGRDDEYLKAPSNSVRLTAYAGDFSFDFAWTPKFTPDNYLTGERFSFYSPIHGENIAPGDNFIVEQTNDDQFSMRISTTQNGVEYALYGYKGFWTSPLSVKPSEENNEQGHAYFSKMNAYGASALTPLGKGLFNAEFSYYNSLEDSNGDKANIANSQLRFLLGYEQELAKDFTASMQYYLEKTLDYDQYQASLALVNEEVAEQAVAEHRHVLTTRLRYATHQQNLIYNLFAFYSPTDNDSYIKPSVTYRYSDELSFSFGANIFIGKDKHTFFGQHEDNSNAWLRMRVHY